MRKLNRSKEFEINIELKDPNFICPPREVQRNMLLNKAIKEFADNLYSLDTSSKNFVEGTDSWQLKERTDADLNDHEIMEDWQIPVMQAMVDEVAKSDRDLLEIGFGRGISSEMIQQRGVKSHTIMECNQSVIKRFDQWAEQYPERQIELVNGLWQEKIGDLGLFNSVFFHTYPLNEEEYIKYVHSSITFSEHFFPYASAHLKENGVFTYLSLEIDSLSRSHQRLLLKHFSSFRLKLVSLDMPDDVEDSWWADSMVVVTAVK